MKRERGLVFLVPEGRFSGGQEGDSWWDENTMFSSHPDPSKCPGEKEQKKYEAESDEFQRNSSGPASFFASASTPCIPFPIPPKPPLQSRKRAGKQEKDLVYKA